jgi:hypothetical protein
LLGFQLEFGLALVRDAFTEALHFWQEHRAERLRCAISTFMEELFPAIVEVVADNSLLLFGGGWGTMYRVSGFTLSENAEYHADADAILYGLSQLMLRRPPSSTVR